MTNPLRKTHPMVLVAAVALTIFSLLGSAAISGLIPTAYSAKQSNAEGQAEQQEIQPSPDDRAPAAGRRKPTTSAACSTCGIIVAIQELKQDGEATGLGAVAGGVTGGVIGNQIGRGRGNTLMTVLGAGGGAYAGHAIEKKVRATTTSYEIRIQMENGSYRTITYYSPPPYRTGDQVRLENGQLKHA